MLTFTSNVSAGAVEREGGRWRRCLARRDLYKACHCKNRVSELDSFAFFWPVRSCLARTTVLWGWWVAGLVVGWGRAEWVPVYDRYVQRGGFVDESMFCSRLVMVGVTGWWWWWWWWWRCCTGIVSIFHIAITGWLA